MSQYVEVTPDLLAGFLDEAPAYLTSLEDGLLVFEEQARDGSIALRNDADHERMNEVFRAAHSLKGIGASLGFDRIRDLTHAMESLFDQLRNGKRELSVSDVETLFGAVDTLRQLIDELSQPVDPPIAIDASLSELNRILSDSGAKKADSPTVPPQGDAAAPASDAEFLTDDAELLVQFVETTGEAIDLLNQHLLELEEQPTEAEIINEVFRCAHNIKGASGAVGCRTMNRFTHEMESVLDRVRANEISIDATLIAALFQAVDHLRCDLDLVKEQCYDQLGCALPLDMFSTWNAEPQETAPAGDDPSPQDASDASMIVRVKFRDGDDEAALIACLICSRLTEVSSSVTADPDVFALDEETEVCEITYRLATDADQDTLKNILSAYRLDEVSIDPIATSAAPSAAAPQPAAVEPSAPQPAAVEPSAPQPPAAESLAAPTSAAAPAPARKAPTPARKAPSAPPQGAPRAKEPGPKVGETIRVDLERLDQLMNLGGELVIAKARFGEISRKLAPVFAQANMNYLVDDMADRLAALQDTSTRLAAAPDSKEISAQLSDASLHLADDFEMIRGLVGRVHDSRATMAEFDEAMHSLNRISEGMQRRIMQTRMVAIGPLFQRFRRSVRDMCKATGKKVELHLHGEATELDKRMIDELVDPLTHMVRNSVDHGIELPDQRREAGKPDVGRLDLDAFHRGRHICIEVRDDGKGLDVERIRSKIIERELATPAQLEQMSDHEAMQYIFRAGFSTAEQVSDLSGRGMGMDIARTRIEALSGTIELNSKPGEGTRLTISLPLTLAIIPAMMVRIGRCAYAVPLETVVEITTIPRDHVQHIQRQAVMRLRDHVIPLTLLEHILSMTHDAQRTDPLEKKAFLTVMILGLQKERLGLIVDHLIGQEDIVIKDVATNFHSVDGVAGASIMGDGSVSLILDVVVLMSNFARHGAQRLALSEATSDAAAPCGG